MSSEKSVTIFLSMSRVFSRLFCILIGLSIASPAFAKLNESSQVQFNLQTPQFDTRPGQVETVKIKVNLPAGFHAYKDQFKIQGIKPSEFKFGQMKITPEVSFFDKYSNQQKLGFKEIGEIEFQIESPEFKENKSHRVEFGLRYQICSEKVCFVPTTRNFKVEFNFAKKSAGLDDGVFHAASTTPDKVVKPGPDKSFFDFIKFDPTKNIALTLLLIFLSGIMTSFTPCIFPMIPITLSILGHNAQNNSRAKNLTRSIMYVLGIATTYAILGVVAALTGSLFGKFLAHRVVIWSMAALFVVMALGMWGLFEIQAPAAIRNKFQSGRVTGFSGVFLMGLIAGVVASPCVGPVLVSILSFVSMTQDAFLGFLYLFTYAIGLGLIFIVIGMFSEVLKLLPRSGGWMDTVKFILGLVMIVMALYYVQVIISKPALYSLGSFLFMLVAGWKTYENFKRKTLVKFGIALALCISFMVVFILAAMMPKTFESIPIHTQDPAFTQQVPGGAWLPYNDENLKKALAAGKPIIVDFWAEWCAACHELKEKTFAVPEFTELSKHFTLLVLDVTEDTDENQKILTKYGVQGLPTVYFMNSNGEHLKDLTFTQFIEWAELKVKMESVLK